MANTTNRSYPKPVATNHVSDDVLLLQAAFDAIDADMAAAYVALANRSLVGHTHAIADVTGLQAALDGKSPTGHTHTLASLTDVVNAAGAATGWLLVKASDGTWIPASPSAALGTITVAIGSVTGLTAALAAKAATTDLAAAVAPLNHALFGGL